MTPKYREEVNKLLASLDDENTEAQKPQTELPLAEDQEPPPPQQEQIYDVWSIPGKKGKKGFIVIRADEEEEDEQGVIDSTASDLDTAPLTAQQATSTGETGVVYFGLYVSLVTLFCIMVQFYVIVNPFTVTVTLAARSQQLTLQGSLQLGRVLNPITVSQSQTVPTTGKGHQDAHSATGSITFYNGQLQSVFMPAGTYLTSANGIQVVTDADANIPAADPTANPPVFGQTSVSAHAVSPGSAGNIPAYDISQPCCLVSVIAKNLQSFTGGQDERNFQTVAKSDIDNAAAPLKATVTQGSNAALQGQLKTNEALVTPSCTTSTTPDHRLGEEATQVKVTVSETCSAVAYNQDTLQAKVTQLLTAQAVKKLETGYSLLGNPQITVTSATTAKQVMLSFNAQSTWVYALSGAEQKNIKNIIAGKTKAQAMQLLNSLPGIEGASLQSSGFGDDTKLPKDIVHIHLLVIYTTA